MLWMTIPCLTDGITPVWLYCFVYQVTVSVLCNTWTNSGSNIARFFLLHFFKQDRYAWKGLLTGNKNAEKCRLSTVLILLSWVQIVLASLELYGLVTHYSPEPTWWHGKWQSGRLEPLQEGEHAEASVSHPYQRWLSNKEVTMKMLKASSSGKYCL